MIRHTIQSPTPSFSAVNLACCSPSASFSRPTFCLPTTKPLLAPIYLRRRPTVVVLPSAMRVVALKRSDLSPQNTLVSARHIRLAVVVVVDGHKCSRVFADEHEECGKHRRLRRRNCNRGQAKALRSFRDHDGNGECETAKAWAATEDACAYGCGARIRVSLGRDFRK